MPVAAIAPTETERLRQLYELDILDTPPDRQLDDIVLLAAGLLNAPIALVSLVDEERQWFKARIGLDATETPRDVSFCAHAILSNDGLIVTDALEDRRFSDSPLVIGPPYIRFYAGAPLRTPSGQALGTLCVIDQKPRPGFTHADADRLRRLADLVEQHFTLRWTAQRMMGELQDRQDLVAAFEDERAGYETRLQDKREFLAKAAHEFRTPLNSVQACAAMLRNEIHGPHGEPRYRKYAEIILDAAGYMESLATGLLDYARARSGQFALDCEPVYLGDVLRECIDMMRPSAAIARIQLNTDIDATPLTIHADRLRLKQVFLNLLSNALKFTPAGGQITLALPKTGFGMATVKVIDTGVGIAPEEISRAFAPFGQTSSKSQNGQRGTGLGLPIARLIVERHGGMLTLESDLGRGTTALVRLPCI
jgi:two-component system, sensor histidine kinase